MSAKHKSQKGFFSIPDIKDLKMPLYRIIDFKRLLNFLGEKKLRFVCPITWEDFCECENLRRSYTKQLTNGISLHVGFNLAQRFCALCWSKESECDRLWKAYTPAYRNPSTQELYQHSIQLKTSVEKLKQHLCNQLGGGQNNPVVSINPVQYLSPDEAKAFGEQTFAKVQKEGVTKKMELIQILTKHDWFKYEDEVRVLLGFSDISSLPSSVHVTPYIWRGEVATCIEVDVEPTAFIDGLVADPWCSTDTLKRMQKIVDAFDFPIKIEESNLYRSQSCSGNIP